MVVSEELAQATGAEGSSCFQTLVPQFIGLGAGLTTSAPPDSW